MLGETSDGTVWYGDRDTVKLLAPNSTFPRDWVPASAPPWGPCALDGVAIAHDGQHVAVAIGSAGNPYCEASPLPGLYTMTAGDAVRGLVLKKRMLCFRGSVPPRLDVAFDDLMFDGNDRVSFCARDRTADVDAGESFSNTRSSCADDGTAAIRDPAPHDWRVQRIARGDDWDLVAEPPPGSSAKPIALASEVWSWDFARQ